MCRFLKNRHCAPYLVTELLQLVHGGRAEEIGSDRQRLPQLDVGRSQARHDIPELDRTLDLVLLQRAVDAVDDNASEEATSNAWRHGHADVGVTYGCICTIWRMPGMNDTDLSKSCQARPSAFRSTPMVVFISSHQSIKMNRLCMFQLCNCQALYQSKATIQPTHDKLAQTDKPTQIQHAKKPAQKRASHVSAQNHTYQLRNPREHRHRAATPVLPDHLGVVVQRQSLPVAVGHGDELHHHVVVCKVAGVDIRPPEPGHQYAQLQGNK